MIHNPGEKLEDSLMKPRIIFGLIFGVLGIPLFYYAFNAVAGECWGPVLIGVLAGAAGLTTSLTEKVQNSGEAGKAGATTGAIIGVLLGVSMGVGFYSPDGTLSSVASAIFFTIFISTYLGAITTVVGAVAAIIATPNIFQSLIKSVVQKGKKYQLALIAGVTAAVLTYFMTPGFVTLLSQSGIFNAWSSIKSPPSGIARILGVTDAAFKPSDDVWIETQDGQVFSASVCTGYSQPCGDPPQWQSSSITPEYFSHYTSGTDCKKLGAYPLNPSGQIVECRYYIFWENDLSTEIYYALMADGSLQYFVADFVVQIALLFKFALTLLLVYITVFLSSFRLTKYLARLIT